MGTSSHTRLMGRKGCAVAERREQRAQVTHITDVCCGGASDYQHPAGGGVVCLACVVVSPPPLPQFADVLLLIGMRECHFQI